MAERIDQSERQSYYGEGRQPWDDIVEAGFGLQFAAGSILKYLRRAKGEREKDVEKARWYWARFKEIGVSLIDYADGPVVLEWLQTILTNEEKELLK